MGKFLRLVGVMCLAIILSNMCLEAEAKYRGINQFCKTSYWRMMCTRQVNNASTYSQALTNCIQSTIDFNGVLQKSFPQVLNLINKHAPHALSREVNTKTCQEEFSDYAYNLNKALHYSAQNDTGSILSFLSSCNTIDCEDGFNSLGIDFPPLVQKLLRLMFKHIDNCFAVAKQN